MHTSPTRLARGIAGTAVRAVWATRLLLAALIGVCAWPGLAMPAYAQALGLLGPSFELTDHNGKTFSSGMLAGQPYAVFFGFTHCPDVCPTTLQEMTNAMQGLGADADRLRVVFVTVDPEQDTPAHLRAYAQQFHAVRGWDHYTGTMAASIAVQRAFGAYHGDKMSHAPLTLMRAAPGRPWVRLDGFATGRDLLAERKLWPDSPGLARAVQ